MEELAVRLPGRRKRAQCRCAQEPFLMSGLRASHGAWHVSWASKDGKVWVGRVGKTQRLGKAQRHEVCGLGGPPSTMVEPPGEEKLP